MDCEKLYRCLKSNHNGRKNAALSKQLEAAFSCKGSELRKCINSLRTRGIPICSSTEGYYYSENEDDISGTINQLRGRVRKIECAQNGMSQIILSQRRNENAEEN